MKSKRSFLYFFISGLLLLGIFSLTSCLEGDDDSFRTTSSVLFVNVYNDAAQGVNINVDDRKWTYGYRLYDSINTYNAFYSGTHSFSAIPEGLTSAVVSVSQDLKSDTLYTCFVTGKTGEGKMAFFVDTMASARSGKVKIRFVNLSPDMAKIDFGIADSTRKFINLEYLSAAYFTIDTGMRKYNVYSASLKTPLKSLNFRPSPGVTYTMYTKGLIARKGVDSVAISYFVQPVK
ncbi:DUF4397 domain-containing protein [Arcticibacter eurypsychrophilus]|uniref:DUF4397 domain-containing protein n=1 Tax=Arcticibacter eurypsychrophilus TaxID=1434752 RepID=UPI00084D7C00|nr:DUF4397 domain-containing protein [Arcticibacter eurypsychrophilus]